MGPCHIGCAADVPMCVPEHLSLLECDNPIQKVGQLPDSVLGALALLLVATEDKSMDRRARVSRALVPVSPCIAIA